MLLPVERRLQNHQVPYRLIPLSRTVVTHRDAKETAQGANPDDDCKTIMVKDSSGKVFALFLPGGMRVNFQAIHRLLGKKVDILTVQELKQATGKERGAVCPLLLDNVIIMVDRRVLERKKAFFSSGEPLFGLEISTQDLNKLMTFQVGDFATVGV